MPLESTDGKNRFEIEYSYDQSVRSAVRDYGRPDFIYVHSDKALSMIWLDQDTGATTQRTALDSRGQFHLVRPIPDEWVSLLPEVDRINLTYKRWKSAQLEHQREADRSRVEIEAQSVRDKNLAAARLEALKASSEQELAEYEIQAELEARKEAVRARTQAQADEELRKQGDRAAAAFSPAGTCFVVSETGRIATAYHVIAGSGVVEVLLHDGRRLDATIEAKNSLLDIALLKVAERTPEYLSLAPTGSVRLGDNVFTVGFPVADVLGTSPKYTEGSISSLSGLVDEAGFFQISVPVQPGNSGGPLVNSRGDVVGIVVSTAAVERFYERTGALPQNVSWAVKSEYLGLLIGDPVPRLHGASSRTDATDRAVKAVCAIRAGT